MARRNNLLAGQNKPAGTAPPTYRSKAPWSPRGHMGSKTHYSIIGRVVLVTLSYLECHAHRSMIKYQIGVLPGNINKWQYRENIYNTAEDAWNKAKELYDQHIGDNSYVQIRINKIVR
jgi:hypothetical protein